MRPSSHADQLILVKDGTGERGQGDWHCSGGLGW